MTLTPFFQETSIVLRGKSLLKFSTSKYIFLCFVTIHRIIYVLQKFLFNTNIIKRIWHNGVWVHTTQPPQPTSSPSFFQ